MIKKCTKITRNILLTTKVKKFLNESTGCGQRGHVFFEQNNIKSIILKIKSIKPLQRAGDMKAKQRRKKKFT